MPPYLKSSTPPLGPALEAGVAQVIADRGARSRAFFERNGEAFEASQDLIALPDRYLPVLTEWLPAGGAQALEIGPGLGEFLPTLLDRFDTVWAVDRSEEMLRRCAQRLAKDGEALPHFHCGAFEQLDGRNAAARDHRVVVLAMVLHHSQTPAALTRAAVRASRPTANCSLQSSAPMNRPGSETPAAISGSASRRRTRIAGPRTPAPACRNGNSSP